MQMVLADVMKRAVNSTLQKAEVALDRVRVNVAANVFACGVSDRLVL